MTLPTRQQQTLDQIEDVLKAADPRLESMFAGFRRMARLQAMPATEVISVRPVRRVLVICGMVLSMLGLLVLGIRTSSNDCPGLSSDQVVASASARYAACHNTTDVWSRGAR